VLESEHWSHIAIPKDLVARSGACKLVRYN